MNPYSREGVKLRYKSIQRKRSERRLGRFAEWRASQRTEYSGIGAPRARLALSRKATSDENGHWVYVITRGGEATQAKSWTFFSTASVNLLVFRESAFCCLRPVFVRVPF